ncbi:hypothetical protein PHET_05538 [Paragonimus heterotremus]|uniref:Uncharacterized protein n=1 Tax=Paragonimus heterotremus TaxID=100268 RepID=A0A8J4SPH8_9TREM|nr:hypothetical protein PHET_05538 [Paragonimus heterotremus]
MSTLISTPVRGRKVVRTVTAPTIMRPSERLKRMSLERPSEPDKETLRFPEQSVSLYELNGQCPSSPDHLSRSLSRTEVHSKYSLRQQMKETMATITPSDPTTPPQRRHRREITRCWSRERVIRSEVILSIRRPTDRSMNELSIPTEQHTIPHRTPVRSCSARQTGTLDDHSGQSTAFSSSHSLFAVASAVGKRIPIRTCYTNAAETEPSNVSFQVVPMEPSSSQVQPIIQFANEQVMQTPEEYVTDMT